MWFAYAVSITRLPVLHCDYQHLLDCKFSYHNKNEGQLKVADDLHCRSANLSEMM